MSYEFWGSVAAAILCGLASFGFSEWRRQWTAGKTEGAAETTANLLAQAFAEFKHDWTETMKEMKAASESARLEIKADFQRLYSSLDNRNYPCSKEQILGTMQGRIEALNDRANASERGLVEIRDRLASIEASLRPKS